MENTHLFTGTTQNHGICEVLYAASWIVGEFSEHLTDPRSTLDSLLNPKVVALPPHIQAVFVQNIVKLYASILVKAEAEVSVTWYFMKFSLLICFAQSNENFYAKIVCLLPYINKCFLSSLSFPGYLRGS